MVLNRSKQGAIPPCKEEREDIQSYYQPLASCLVGTASKRWVPIQNRSSDSQISPAELEIHGKYSYANFTLFILIRDQLVLIIDLMFVSAGVQQDEFHEDFESSRSDLRNFWSLLTPLIFSDHPTRPGDEDP